MKRGTEKIIAQVPIEVATFLLNEKRSLIEQLEQRQNIRILVIPVRHMETPHYEVQRIKSKELREGEEESKSYELARTGGERAPVLTWEAPQAEPAAIRDFLPATPAPEKPAAPPPSAASREQQSSGLIQRFWKKLVGSGEEETGGESGGETIQPPTQVAEEMAPVADTLASGAGESPPPRDEQRRREGGRRGDRRRRGGRRGGGRDGASPRPNPPAEARPEAVEAIGDPREETSPHAETPVEAIPAPSRPPRQRTNRPPRSRAAGRPRPAAPPGENAAASGDLFQDTAPSEGSAPRADTAAPRTRESEAGRSPEPAIEPLASLPPLPLARAGNPIGEAVSTALSHFDAPGESGDAPSATDGTGEKESRPRTRGTRGGRRFRGRGLRGGRRPREAQGEGGQEGSGGSENPGGDFAGPPPASGDGGD
jgi:ribonuclease E